MAEEDHTHDLTDCVRPSLAEPHAADGSSIDFDVGDPDDPLNWTKIRKWVFVILLASLQIMVSLGTTIAAPVSPQILRDFDSDNKLYQTLLISIWELGETFGPLILGPLSEIYGRAVIFNISNVFFICSFVGTALSTNIHMLIAFRFLSGAAVAAPYIGPGIVGDMFPPEQRGLAMSIVSMTGVLGPTLGPLLGSYLGESKGWRWAFWLPTILQGFFSLLFLLFYRETYTPILLRRKVSRMRKEQADPSLRAKYQSDQSTVRQISTGILRPLRLLVSSPVLLLATMYASVNNGYVYLVITILAPLVQNEYGFSEGASGLAYIGLGCGLFLGSLFTSYILDLYVKRMKARQGSEDLKPELRLPAVVVAGLVMPVGLFMLGWTTQAHAHWIAPIIASGVVSFAYLAINVALNSYVVDAFGMYRVSAVSAMLFPRNASAAFFPLAAPPLFGRLGYGWGLSVLGFIALAFVPVPLLWIKFGEQLRKRSSGK